MKVSMKCLNKSTMDVRRIIMLPAVKICFASFDIEDGLTVSSIINGMIGTHIAKKMYSPSDI